MKNHTFLSLIIIFLLVGFPLRSYAEDPIVIGKAALERGDLQAAIKAFKEAVRKDKKNPEGYLLLGTAYLKSDSLDQAVGVLVQARELAPQNPNVYDLLGDVYANQTIAIAAIEQYKKAIELDKKNKVIYFKLAEVSRKARQYEEAAKAYINVLLIDSTNIIAVRELAQLYVRAKQYQNALPLLRDLVKLQPDSLSYQISYVRVLYETKYYVELKPYADSILAKDSTQIEIQNMLRDACMMTGEYIKAVKLFSKVNADTLSAEELVKHGVALKKLEKYDEAISSYEMAYRKDSTLTDIYYDLATLYNKKERYADAVVMFGKKLTTDTTANYRWACYFQAAQSYSNMKDYKKAKEYILKSIEIKSEYIPAWDMLALYNGALGLTAEQNAAYKKVIELISKADTNGNGGASKYKSSLNAAYVSLGSQAMNDKKYPEAIEYFKKALQINPKDCGLLLAVGSLSQRTKNEDEAQKYYCKVLQSCPKSEQAKIATNALKGLGLDCK